MRLLDIHGRERKRNVSKYSIRWDAPSKSKLQFRVKKFLQKYWKGYVVYEEFPVFGTRMAVDFLNISRNIAIEVNGAQHSKFSKFFHNNSKNNFLKSMQRDIKKAEWLERNGIKLIELEENDVKNISIAYIQENFGIEI